MEEDEEDSDSDYDDVVDGRRGRTEPEDANEMENGNDGEETGKEAKGKDDEECGHADEDWEEEA